MNGRKQIDTFISALEFTEVMLTNLLIKAEIHVQDMCLYGRVRQVAKFDWCVDPIVNKSRNLK